jgi:hypothetical protein
VESKNIIHNRQFVVIQAIEVYSKDGLRVAQRTQQHGLVSIGQN